MSATLKALVKKFRDDIQSNKDVRDTLGREANHYIQEDINNLESQISLVGAKVEAEFRKKYGQALSVLASKGMTDVTFSKISSTLKQQFLGHFADLKELGVETGHLYSVLTTGSKYKASSMFEKDIDLKSIPGANVRYTDSGSYADISNKELTDIAKTIALISSYIRTIEELDNIQDKKGLLAFLKKSNSFKSIAKSRDLATIDNIKEAISVSFGSNKNVKGFSELGGQILDTNILSIEASSLMDMKRSITASSDKIAVTFEISAFNKLKGTISKGIQGQVTKYLDAMLEGKGDTGISARLNAALLKSINTTVTKASILELFPKATASKSMVQAIGDIVAETIRTGKASTYVAKSPAIRAQPISSKIKVTIPKLKLKTPGKTVGTLPINRIKPSTSAINLLAILQAGINKQVAKNMGQGNEHRVLNYRTGRFAESVQVQRLSESRQGMITAFYSYMRNPYGTFSEGGRQQFPKSRDPKLLISKSVRELAAPIVGARMRAVLV